MAIIRSFYASRSLSDVDEALQELQRAIEDIRFDENYLPAPSLADFQDTPHFTDNTDRLSGLATIRYMYLMS